MKKVPFSSCAREAHVRRIKNRFQPCECMRKHAFAGQNTQQAYTSKMNYALNPNDMSFNMTRKEKIIKIFSPART